MCTLTHWPEHATRLKEAHFKRPGGGPGPCRPPQARWQLPAPGTEPTAWDHHGRAPPHRPGQLPAPSPPRAAPSAR